MTISTLYFEKQYMDIMGKEKDYDSQDYFTLLLPGIY